MSGCYQCTETQLCYYCARKAEKYKPKDIKPRSDKRAKIDRVYNARVKIWKEENPLCMARLNGCNIKTTQCHHIEPRTERNLLIEDNWLPVCTPCHNWITEHSSEAIEMKLSKSRIKN